MSEPASGAVIVISSHVIRGSVGNRAAVFALETLGYPVWAVPTVILPWHPGHGPSTRITVSEGDFNSLIDDLIRARAPEPTRRWWDVMRDEGDDE